MSDLSVSLQLIAASPAPLNAGSMFAAGITTSNGIARFSNKRASPRRIPGVSDSPRRGFISTDRALVGGNVTARDMLGHIRYWLEPDENGKPRSKRFIDGHYWVVCSQAFWMQQLAVPGRQEVRTAIEALEKSGAVVREVKRYGNNDTDHYRLVLEVAGIQTRDTPVTANQPMVASNHHMVTSNQPMVTSNQPTSLKLPLKLGEVSKNKTAYTNPTTKAKPDKEAKPQTVHMPKHVFGKDWDTILKGVDPTPVPLVPLPKSESTFGVSMTDEEKKAAYAEDMAMIEAKLKPKKAAPTEAKTPDPIKTAPTNPQPSPEPPPFNEDYIVQPAGWAMQPSPVTVRCAGSADLTVTPLEAIQEDDEHQTYRLPPTDAEEAAQIVANREYYERRIREQAEASAAQAIKKAKAKPAANMQWKAKA